MEANVIRSGSMTFELLTVTPEMARQWLESNTGNRPVRKKAVDRLAGVMEAGGFGLTHQGIAFDVSGRLIDGQHRLLAIVGSGTAARLLVCRGMPAESVSLIDDRVGGTRTICDHLGYLGVNVTTRKASIARLLMLHAVAQRRGSADGEYSWTFDTRLAPNVWARFYSDVEESVEFGHSSLTSNPKVAHAAVAAAVASAWFSKQCRDRLQEFAVVMATGAVASADDSAAIRLRDFLLTTGLRSGGESARMQIFIRASTALRAFVERRPMAKLYARTESLFSVPFFSYL